MTSRSSTGRTSAIEVKAEKSFSDHHELSVYRKSDTYLFLSQGEILNKLRNDELYKLTNGGMSWEDYLKQPEISLTAGQARQRIECYLLFVKSMGMSLEELGFYPLPALKFILGKFHKKVFANATEIRQVMEASKQLSLKDLKEFVHDANTETIEGAPRTYEFLIMKRCIETGNMTKVHDIASEDIKSKFNLE